MTNLLYVKSNSSALIENNTLTDNNASLSLYYVEEKSSIQLNDAVFIRNRLMGNLLIVTSSSSSIIENNTLTDSNASLPVYYVEERTSF